MRMPGSGSRLSTGSLSIHFVWFENVAKSIDSFLTDTFNPLCVILNMQHDMQKTQTETAFNPLCVILAKDSQCSWQDSSAQLSIHFVWFALKHFGAGGCTIVVKLSIHFVWFSARIIDIIEARDNDAFNPLCVILETRSITLAIPRQPLFQSTLCDSTISMLW